MFSNSRYRQRRVYRVIVHHQNGFSTGSGFFTSKNYFITCFHVAFATDLRMARLDPVFVSMQGNDEQAKLRNYFNNRIRNIQIELPEGERLDATLKDFDAKYDIAVLEVNTSGRNINTCILNFHPGLELGDYVVFGGYPMHHDYAFDKTPFATHEGIISSYIETIAGGERYMHLQINSINLGGNSGAPLFKKGGRKVIGIINANMQSGNDHVLLQDPVTNNTFRGAIRIPLSIAYATSLKTLAANTNIFSLIKK